MGLVDYLMGERFSLHSPLPPAQVAARLEGAIESSFEPFVSGVVGWVALGRFALSYRKSRWRGDVHRPSLNGRIEPDGTGSRIIVRYGPPRSFLLVALIILPFVAYDGAVALLHRAPIWPVLPFAFVFLLMILAYPLVDWGAREGDLSILLAVVEEAADRAG